MPSWNETSEKHMWKRWARPFVQSVRPQIFLFISILSVFALLMFFTERSFSLFWYGVQLSSFIFLVSLFIQWIAYLNRIREAESLRFRQDIKNDRYSVQSIDALYQEKYKELYEEYQLFKQETAENKEEQMDYFTLWLHQIKTPISAMSLLLQKSPETKDALRLEQELIRVNDYTHMALNYLKLEDSGKELELEDVAVDEVIKMILKKYAVFFIYKDISVAFEPRMQTVLSDKKWLEVLIEQLISNSLKYTKAGEIKIFFEDEQTLIIEDTGSGIRQEDLPKIFEKGYTGLDGRLHSKSTGLGLFLSRKICRRLGHTLTIESEAGKGTKAIVDFGEKSWDLFD
ncbi:sensor histidine kinase [Alkalibacterium putridalgicola]|uniref:sensor histidine kinase n=1 Tax=Alkalibacterium putridalgicola TaxID=426703 RepID=UPI0034CDEE0D